MKKKTLTVIILVLLLNCISIICLYSALHRQGVLFDNDTFIRHIIWIVLGWGLVAAIYFVNYRIFYDLSLWLYYACLALLLFVAITGKIQMGAQRWIQIFGITFQPSELAKFAAILIICRNFLKERKPALSLARDFFQEIVLPFIPVLALFLVIFVQPDLGTAAILLFLFILMRIGAGTKKRNLLILFLIVLIVLPISFSLLKDYQKERLLVFINPDSDPVGAGYTIIQSKIAIGSGQLFGKGFLAGTQNQLNFIPARHTDFIFTVFAEEWGFLGCLALLLIYYLLLKIVLDTAKSVKDKYSYLLCIGIFSLSFIHIFINLSMIMGLLPVVGLPLMFLSYGGSYTLINFILIGILINIQKHTAL
ncbi:rod shape-determining protein RodA [Candidatus Omnitrophota bacterium]